MHTTSPGAVLLAALLAAQPAYAQKATEQFIPIGQSPGISGTLTRIGEIAATDSRARTLTLRDASGTVTVRLTDKTRIFLDRSKLKQGNLEGSTADLQPGRRAEIRPEGAPESPTADWVKVEITQR